MKRKIIALLLTLTMLLTLLTALIACDATADESDDEKTAEETEEESDGNSIKASKEFREVLPGAKRVTDIKSLILGISDGVLEAYEETSGKGYIFKITAEGYKSGIVVLVGIDTNGKVTGSKCIETNDTFGKEPVIDNAYNGQTMDSYAPVMISGATMTSQGYSHAILIALQSFELLTNGKLDPATVLEALIPELAPGFVRPEEIESPQNITKAFRAINDAGFAFIFSNSTTGYLALVNAIGECAVYDIQGNDVTSDQTKIMQDAIACAASNQKSYSSQLNKKINKLYSDASEIKDCTFTTFNTVVAAAEFISNGNKYYAIYSRSMGFNQMDVYIILDSKGAIDKLTAEKFIFDEEYFPAAANMDFPSYAASFNGLTENTFSGDNCIVTGATLTSKSVATSTRDAFDTYKNITH